MGPNILTPHLQMHPWPWWAGHLYREPLAVSPAKSEIWFSHRWISQLWQLCHVTQSPLEHLCQPLIPGSIAVRVASRKVTTKVVTESPEAALGDDRGGPPMCPKCSFFYFSTCALRTKRRTNGPTDQWTNGPMDQLTNWLTDKTSYSH